MGKNHRHKKQLKSEKSKIKLKVKNEKTKFLPKGLNVTNTTFKIKPIILPEQLTLQRDALLSKRKLNIKELSSRLKHHNLTVKYDSCVEIKQLFVSHQAEIVNLHLSELLHAVAPLLLDKERKIRKAALDIFQKLFERAPLENIETFFTVLSSYLRCAMTNIDRCIQEDSLLFLDLLLKYTPKCVAHNCEKILPNLFALISKLRNDAKPGRTLTVNIGSKITNVKWRIQVLSSMYTFLDAVINNQQCVTEGSNMLGMQTFACDSNSLNFIYNPYKQNVIQFSNNMGDSMKTEKESVISNNMSTLLSLLYETWLEVLPSRDYKEIGTENTALSNDAASILSNILNIIYLLLRHNTNAHKSVLDLLSSEGQHFLAYILNQFPFAQQPIDRKKKDKAETHKTLVTNSDPRCIRDNLLICYLFCLLNNGRLSASHKIKQATNILNYVTNCLSKNKQFLNEGNIKYLILVVRTVLIDNYHSWSHSMNANINSLMDKFVIFYETTACRAKFGQQLLNMLCDLSQIPQLNSNPHYQRWLVNLSGVLCRKQVSDKLLESLLLMSKQSNKLFQQGLVDNISAILDNYDCIEISNCTDSNLSKRKILSLYYYVEYLGDAQRQTLITKAPFMNL